MERIRIFNCSHDMALGCGASEYMPPKVVAQMEMKYAPIMQLLDEYFKSETPVVWGWNIPLRNKLLRQGVAPELMPSEAELEMLRMFSSREFWVDYCTQFGYQECRIVENKEQFENIKDFPVILKALWSSSGRGNKIVGETDCKEQVLSGWKFPCVMDRFYDKKLDFAMEFFIREDSVEYLGLSVFKASKEGRYEYNYVASQEELLQMILDSSDIGKDELEKLKGKHIELLSKNLVGKYRGPVGIDMMVTDSEKRIHPCVELNLRMNMGILALAFFRRFGGNTLREMSLDSLLNFLDAR